MNPPPELKARLFEAIKAEKSPTRREVTTQAAVVVGVAIGMAAMLFFALGGPHLEPRPIAFVCGTAIGWSVVAAIAARLAFGRGGSMLGRPRVRLVAVTVITPLVIFGWMLLWNASFPETLAHWPGRVGVRCLSLTLAMAAWPLVALAYLRRERDPANAGWAGAARGVAAGALAGVLVDLWCPIGEPSHILVGHVFPMIVLMAVGAVAGRVLVGVHLRRGAEVASRADAEPGAIEAEVVEAGVTQREAAKIAAVLDSLHTAEADDLAARAAIKR